MEAVAICHMYASDWDPGHILLHLLGVKPGASSPLCYLSHSAYEEIRIMINPVG